MKRPHVEGEHLDAHDVSNAALTASMLTASVGMIWDLATGHVAAFDRMLSNISDDGPNAQNAEQAAAPQRRVPSVASASSRIFHSIPGSRTDA
ncbi:hypothetical protein HYPDE_39183 [Hyphomicrobium denitrificans 1NES1]|uniref:Uncharacterized protein n=1 Tax=Hyphomicrobium denitrificans 1NES1 TaxID=670307 RepID=N0BGH7_9HYPH|nr:hypothetical protein [Hyphomicrobium denitrificans]AGK59506.1 hypothetical protein HYPDE_39183 [Hyphomicrobium denitrificans 1NES1]